MFKSSAPTRSEPAPTHIDSLIGLGTEVDGDIIFSGGIRIEGLIRGDVSVAHAESGILMLGNQGRIVGNVRVSHLIVDGEIDGSVYATDLVEVRGTGKIKGDIHYGLLEVHQGALIDGQVDNLRADT
jgi:cytoskeletal protein CcmA (bactofilin family)